MYFLFDNLYSFSFPYIPTYITSIYSHLGESIIDLEIKIIPSYTRKEIEKWSVSPACRTPSFLFISLFILASFPMALFVLTLWGSRFLWPSRKGGIVASECLVSEFADEKSPLARPALCSSSLHEAPRDTCSFGGFCLTLHLWPLQMVVSAIVDTLKTAFPRSEPQSPTEELSEAETESKPQTEGKKPSKWEALQSPGDPFQFSGWLPVLSQSLAPLPSPRREEMGHTYQFLYKARPHTPQCSTQRSLRSSVGIPSEYLSCYGNPGFKLTGNFRREGKL